MKKIVYLLTLVTFLISGLTQASAQDKPKEKIKVKIETEENGKKEVFERTYSSREEMQADKELRDLGFEGIGESSKKMVLSDSKEDHSKNISIDIDTEHDGDKILVRKVVKDKDGKEKVYVKTYSNVEELAKNQEVDVEVTSDGADYQWSNEDGDVHIKVNKKKGHNTKVKRSVTIEIEEEDGKKKKKKTKQVKVIEKDDNHR